MAQNASQQTGSTRTYWLSFVDPDAAVGSKFLGVCVVDVDLEDAADAQIEAEAAPARDHQNCRCVMCTPDSHAGWIIAAVHQARLMGCNPGGEVQAQDITGDPAPPKNRLLS